MDKYICRWFIVIITVEIWHIVEYFLFVWLFNPQLPVVGYCPLILITIFFLYGTKCCYMGSNGLMTCFNGGTYRALNWQGISSCFLHFPLLSHLMQFAESAQNSAPLRCVAIGMLRCPILFPTWTKWKNHKTIEPWPVATWRPQIPTSEQIQWFSLPRPSHSLLEQLYHFSFWSVLRSFKIPSSPWSFRSLFEASKAGSPWIGIPLHPLKEM